MGANVPIAGHVVATLFTFSVRPWKFEQPTLLKVDFVRKHFASRVLKFPLFPLAPAGKSTGLVHGPVLVPPAVPVSPPAGPAPLEPVPALPPVLEEPPAPTGSEEPAS